MLVSAGFVVVGLIALVVAAALVSVPLAWAAAGASCLVLAMWPKVRAWIARG